MPWQQQVKATGEGNKAERTSRARVSVMPGAGAAIERGSGIKEAVVGRPSPIKTPRGADGGKLGTPHGSLTGWLTS